MIPHYDVLIATPGSDLSNEYVRSLTQTIGELNNKNITWTWLNQASSLVGNAREMTMGGDRTLDVDDTGPLHGRCTYNKIFWIDSDISWCVEDFIKLYESEYAITAGTYLLADGATSTVHTQEYPDGIPREAVLKIKTPIPVDIAGFGFVAVKSGVFESIERPWFGHLSNVIQNSQGKPVYVTVGEDISWCMKARQSGFTIYFDPAVLVTHMKTTPVGWQ